MILLVILLPLSLYLTILGTINRQRRAVMVSGVMDFIGILFAASGFLFFGGPLILSSLNERWRLFWLFASRPTFPGGGTWQSWFWIFLSVLYFLIVVGWAALMFRDRRRLTAIYNAEVDPVQRGIMDACSKLGLQPARSGALFVFGVEPALRITADNDQGVQTASHPPAGVSTPALLQETVVLEMEPFAGMQHITLRWDPPETALRRAVEAELEKTLAETPVEPSVVGGWLMIAGVGMFCMTVVAGAVLVVLRSRFI